MAIGFEFGEARVVGNLIGVGSRLGGPVMFPSKMAGKRCCISDKTEMIKGWGGRKRKTFCKDRRFGGG